MKIKTKIYILSSVLVILVMLTILLFNQKLNHLVVENKVFASISDIFRIQSENQLLTDRLETIEQLTVEKNIIAKENIELTEIKKTVELYKNHQPIVAAVTYRNVDSNNIQSWYNSLYINKGENQNIKINTPVISSKGVIGLIKEVEQDRAEVTLLSNNNKRSYVPATIVDNQSVFGMIESYDIEQNLLYMTKIDTAIEKEVVKGSIVITSNKSTIFPPGLKIGEVMDVQKDNYGLTNTATVKPAADFHDLNYVVVLTTDG